LWHKVKVMRKAMRRRYATRIFFCGMFVRFRRDFIGWLIQMGFIGWFNVML